MQALLISVAMAALVLSAGTPAARAATPFVKNELLVDFHPGTPGAEQAAAHAHVGGHVLRTLPGIGVAVVSVTGSSVPAAVEAYRRNPNVLFAEPNYLRPLIIPVEGAFESGLNVFDLQWNLHNTGAGIPGYVDPNTGLPLWTLSRVDADIDAPEAWDVSQGSPGVWVAVLDSGVDCDHGDLLGKCIHIEDHVTPEIDEWGSPIPDFIDRAGHGTHVAGTIAMSTNNQEGGAGIGWDISIGSFKVCYVEYLLGIPVGSNCEDADIAAGIVAITDHGYHVINMSFGGDPSAAIQAALDYASSNGVLLVSAAGNNGDWQKYYPAAYANVISVGATDPYDERASFSSFSVDDDFDPSTSDDDWVDLMAPGSPILSTAPADACTPPSAQCFGWKEGTSMAAPHVSGVAGLVWSHLLATDPANANATEVRRRLQDCADSIGALGQNMLAYSRFGRLNAAAALTCDGGTPPPPPPPGVPVPPVHVADLDAAGVSASGPTWSADVVIAVHDFDHQAVEGVGVSGSWNASTGSGSTSCTTDASGNCTISRSGIRKKEGSVSFTVTGLTGYDYDAGANHDDDGSSNGTTASASKP